MIWFGCNSICVTLNPPFSIALFFGLCQRFHIGKSFEGSLCSGTNHICPITVWPVAAVGPESEWVMCYPFKCNFSHANAWHVWLCSRALGLQTVFLKWRGIVVRGGRATVQSHLLHPADLPCLQGECLYMWNNLPVLFPPFPDFLTQGAAAIKWNG